MPILDLDQDKLNALYAGGHISPEVYNRMMGPPMSDAPMDAPMDPSAGMMLASAGPNMGQGGPMFASSSGQSMALDGFVSSPDENAKRDVQLQMLAKNQGMSLDDKKRALARKAGIDEELINQRLGAPKTGSSASSGTKGPATPAPKLTSDPAAMADAPKGSAASPYDAGFNKQIQGVQDAALATGQKTDAQNLDINNHLSDMDTLEYQRQLDESTRRAKMETAVNDLDASTNAVASMKVDPKQFWAKAETGDKVLMGISLFLGAFGAANDGVNRVVPIITSAIDRDIAAQKANIANANQGVSNKASALSQMRNVFSDERMAEQAAKIAALEKVKMQIMQKSMQYSSPEVQANAKKLVGELDVKKAEARQKFLEAAKNGGFAKLSPSDQLSRQKYNDERMTPLGKVSDPREAPKIRDMKSVVDPLRSNLADLEAITKEGSSWIPYSERSKRAGVLATDTQLQMKELNRLGVLSQGDLELMQKLIPSDPTAIFQTNAYEGIQEAHKLVKRKWKAFVEARGLKDPTLDDKPRGK